MSLTLQGNLGNVKVRYTYMPFARVIVSFRQDSPVRTNSPDGQLHGRITACYAENNCVIGKNDSESHPLILFDQMSSEPAPVHYWRPIILRRSLVCIPAYGSLFVKLDNFIFFKDEEEQKIDFSKDFKYNLCGLTHCEEELSINNVHVTVEVKWFTTDALEIILGEQDNLKGASTFRIPKSPRIQVLLIFVGHGCNTQVDICGYVALDNRLGSRYIFNKKDKGCPRNLSSRKAPTLELKGVISYPGNHFAWVVRLSSEGHVDVNNYFGIGEYEYCLLPGKWRNRPLCKVVLGKQGFAAVHFIVFESAVKATVKISVSFTDSNASGSVYGTLVARYGNYKYSTKYQKKYWSIDLLQVEEKDAQSLSKDGEISLVRDVVSVPEGSSLILGADLHVTCSSDGRVYRFKEEVKITIGGDGRTIQRQTYRRRTYHVVVSTNW